jgi:hypothetical protein
MNLSAISGDFRTGSTGFPPHLHHRDRRVVPDVAHSSARPIGCEQILHSSAQPRDHGIIMIKGADMVIKNTRDR